MSATGSLLRRVAYSVAGAGRHASRHSWLKSAFILCFVIAFEAGLFALFLSGFRFISGMGSIGSLIVHRLFSLFFLGLSLMLVLSSAITSYATIYRSGEIPFLLVRPYSFSQIVLYKFAESCLLSSWAFFFIIVPFVGSYAWHERLSPLLGAWTVLFSVPFLVLCSTVGALVTMAVVRWAPRGVFLKIAVAVFLLAVVAAIWLTARHSRQGGDPANMILSQMVPGLQAAAYPLLPSWWISEGIASLSNGAWLRGAMLFAMLTSTAMVGCLAVEAAGRVLFYPGWQKAAGGQCGAAKHQPLLGWMEGALAFVARDIRAIVVKDMRMFLRDPMQWSQFLVFFGLLGIYFLSLRSFRYHELSDVWRSLIAFLNIFSVATVLCSLSSRFVYPQLSLEGQGFWTLGLSPTTMGRILMTKFCVALAGMSCISVALMYLSARMLGMHPSIQLIAVALAGAISIAVSGMSTGLGAIFLDLKQRNPAAIVSGFGGTLNLVLGLAYMLAVVVPFAVLFHLHFTGRLNPRGFTLALTLASAWLCVLTVIAATVPLFLGRRSLRSREY